MGREWPEANNPASDFHDHGQYSLKKKRNTSSPTFEPAHKACAGQHAALSGQAAATAMQHVHLDELSAKELVSSEECNRFFLSRSKSFN